MRAGWLTILFFLLLAGTVQAVETDVALSPKEEQARFVVPNGFEVELVAAEPDVINPISTFVDDRGRIFVSESHTYRYGAKGTPITPYGNPVVMLERQGAGYRRKVIVDGFEDPVMGILVLDDKLYLSNNNFVYCYDLDDAGNVSNKKTVLTDRKKAWNPFGNYVLEEGPDGLIYLSVGNHNMDIAGPQGQRMKGRRSSGIVMRMNPDGTGMERLIHGLRAPYAHEMDPYGQLWVLSNGEGNPNRFIRVIEGVDYHCYSRNVSNEWLAGRHVLAPPCEALAAGAFTQLLRYDAAAYPSEYQGNLLLANWGAHGFNGGNREIARFVLDDRDRVMKRETLLANADPYFRPSHLSLDSDGSLLIADWYENDDRSDLTGRIWRLRYVGTDARPEDRAQPLASPSHLSRRQAMKGLIKKGDGAVKELAQTAEAGTSLAAANALWGLVRIGSEAATAAVASGAKHKDWRVRRLTATLCRRYRLPSATAIAEVLVQDADPAVQLEAALAFADSATRTSGLLAALHNGAAADPHLRYKAGWHLAKHAPPETIASLMSDPALALVGAIAMDIANYEKFSSRQQLAKAVPDLLLDPDAGAALERVLLAASEWPDKAMVPAIKKVLERPDLNSAERTMAILLLTRFSHDPGEIGAAASLAFLQAVADGRFELKLAGEKLMTLGLCEQYLDSPHTLKVLRQTLGDRDQTVRWKSHRLTRKMGDAAAALIPDLWRFVQEGDELAAVEAVPLLAMLEQRPNIANWTRLLHHRHRLVRMQAVRSWKQFADEPELVQAMATNAQTLAKQVPECREDLANTLPMLGLNLPALNLPDRPTPDTLRRQVIAGVQRLRKRGKTPQKTVSMGRNVFHGALCAKCHAVSDDQPDLIDLAPGLVGLGKSQTAAYVMESIEDPSRVIKTGYLPESVTMKDGSIHLGIVREQGNQLRVVTLGSEQLLLVADIAKRETLNQSTMPLGLHQAMTTAELRDLIAYLLSL